MNAAVQRGANYVQESCDTFPQIDSLLEKRFGVYGVFSSAFWRFSIPINTDIYTHEHTWIVLNGPNTCNFMKSSYFLELEEINDTISKCWQLT